MLLPGCETCGHHYIIRSKTIYKKSFIMPFEKGPGGIFIARIYDRIAQQILLVCRGTSRVVLINYSF